MGVRIVLKLIAILLQLALGCFVSPTIACDAPAPAVAPATADAFTQALQDKNDRVWSGGDQAASVRLPNGRVYWLFGDTMLSDGEAADGSYPAGSTMIGNRILIQNGAAFDNARADGSLGPTIPNPSTSTPDNGERYWAISGLWVNPYFLVFAARVKNSSAGFVPLGTEIARFTVDAAGKLTFRGMLRTPSTGATDGFGPGHIQWGNDVVTLNGYAYVYGSARAEANPYVPIFSYVARVPLAYVGTPSAWRFYRKTTGSWVSSTAYLSQDATNQPDAILATQVSSVRIVGGRTYIVHKPWNGWGTEVRLETGAVPWGPFTSRVIFDSPAGTWEDRNYITYSPMLHPEQTLASGALLVSICWNGVDFWQDTLKNADLSKPRFYEVPR